MHLDLKPLSQQTWVITGASSGINLVTARQAAHCGARVLLVSRDEQALSQIRDDIVKNGGEASYVVADVGVESDVQRVAEELKEPGRHYRPESWVDAKAAKQQRELESEYRSVRAKIIARGGEPLAVPVGAPPADPRSQPASFLVPK